MEINWSQVVDKHSFAESPAGKLWIRLNSDGSEIHYTPYGVIHTNMYKIINELKTN